VLYSRLLALGRGARVGLSLADTVVERLRGYDEAFVVVEGQGAKEIQQALGLAPRWSSPTASPRCAPRTGSW
jgi:hypothetical protein